MKFFIFEKKNTFRGKYLSFFCQIPGGMILLNGKFGEGYFVVQRSTKKKSLK